MLTPIPYTRRHLLTLCVASTLSLAIAGCASDIPPRDAPRFAPAPPAPPGMATLYIFRPYLTDIASAVWPVTYLNGVKVADVKVDSYTYIYVRPGEYEITTERSWALSGLGNVPGRLNISTTGDYYLAFITTGRSSVVQVGVSAMSIAGPSSNSWRILTMDEAIVWLRKLRFIAPYQQALPSE